MTIIEIPQGYYNNLDGAARDAAVAVFTATDADFLKRNPGCEKWHRPSWREFDVQGNVTAPWGYEWYQVDEAGLLKRHSAQYDSSG